MRDTSREEVSTIIFPATRMNATAHFMNRKNNHPYERSGFKQEMYKPKTKVHQPIFTKNHLSSGDFKPTDGFFPKEKTYPYSGDLYNYARSVQGYRQKLVNKNYVRPDMIEEVAVLADTSKDKKITDAILFIPTIYKKLAKQKEARDAGLEAPPDAILTDAEQKYVDDNIAGLTPSELAMIISALPLPARIEIAGSNPPEAPHPTAVGTSTPQVNEGKQHELLNLQKMIIEIKKPMFLVSDGKIEVYPTDNRSDDQKTSTTESVKILGLKTFTLSKVGQTKLQDGSLGAEEDFASIYVENDEDVKTLLDIGLNVAIGQSIPLSGLMTAFKVNLENKQKSIQNSTPPAQKKTTKMTQPQII